MMTISVLLAMTVGVLLVITVSRNDGEGGLEASVDYGSVEGTFDVVDDSVGGEEGFHVEGLEVVVGDCEDDGVKPSGREFADDVYAIFVSYMGCICPRVIYRYAVCIFLKGMVDVHYLCIADVGAVFLEGDAEDEDFRVLDHDAFLVHALDGLFGDVGSHSVVESAR